MAVQLDRHLGVSDHASLLLYSAKRSTYDRRAAASLLATTACIRPSPFRIF